MNRDVKSLYIVYDKYTAQSIKSFIEALLPVYPNENEKDMLFYIFKEMLVKK